MRLFLALIFSCLNLIVVGQQQNCKVEFTLEQELQLKSFQANMYAGNVSLNKTQVKYVPLKIHLVGTNEGLGYFSIDNVLKAVCEVNERFAETGFYFYIPNEINYINNNDLYAGKADAIWSSASSYKDNTAVNVFFHGLNTEGWCGVYFGGVDVVFILNRCQLSGSTTLAHELGHFFSLPHTFRGWENGNIPSNIEKLDGSNCQNAGDGFCDTKADYVGNRWGCPLGWELTDPNNIKFRPDSSLYMNYAMDQCHSRFSNQQMMAMQSNLQNRNIATLVQPNITALDAPNLLAPAANDTVTNAQNVKLTWNKVDGAFAYHVQIARHAAWEYLNFDKLIINDTTVTAKLYGNWPFSWRVKAVTMGNVCSSFSEPKSFYAKELAAGIAELNLDNDFVVYPNPLNANNQLLISTKHPAQLHITNALGQLIQHVFVEPNDETYVKFEEKGIYFITILSKGKTTSKKIVVN